MRVRLAACAALLLLLGACTAGGAATPAPGAATSPAASAGAAVPSGPAGSEPTSGTAGSGARIPTTATAWGAILDRAPASFPRYPGAADSNGAIGQPVTQAVSTSVSVATVSIWYASALSSVGYKQTSISNPAEDGSVVAEFDGGSLASGCRAQLTYRPMGSLTFIFVLVGAACPTA